MFDTKDRRIAPLAQRRGVSRTMADLLGGLLVLAAATLVLLHSAVLP